MSPFTGFEHGMVFRFGTGDVWQQVEATFARHNEVRPSAVVVDGLGGTVLKVEGIDTVVEVRRVARRSRDREGGPGRIHAAPQVFRPGNAVPTTVGKPSGRPALAEALRVLQVRPLGPGPRFVRQHEDQRQRRTPRPPDRRLRPGHRDRVRGAVERPRPRSEGGRCGGLQLHRLRRHRWTRRRGPGMLRRPDRLPAARGRGGRPNGRLPRRRYPAAFGRDVLRGGSCGSFRDARGSGRPEIWPVASRGRGGHDVWHRRSVAKVGPAGSRMRIRSIGKRVGRLPRRIARRTRLGPGGPDGVQGGRHPCGRRVGALAGLRPPRLTHGAPPRARVSR